MSFARHTSEDVADTGVTVVDHCYPAKRGNVASCGCWICVSYNSVVVPAMVVVESVVQASIGTIPTIMQINVVIVCPSHWVRNT